MHCCQPRLEAGKTPRTLIRHYKPSNPTSGPMRLPHMCSHSSEGGKASLARGVVLQKLHALERLISPHPTRGRGNRFFSTLSSPWRYGYRPVPGSQLLDIDAHEDLLSWLLEKLAHRYVRPQYFHQLPPLVQTLEVFDIVAKLHGPWVLACEDLPLRRQCRCGLEWASAEQGSKQLLRCPRVANCRLPPLQSSHSQLALARQQFPVFPHLLIVNGIEVKSFQRSRITTVRVL